MQNKLINLFKAEFPSIKFVRSSTYRWDPSSQTIYYTIGNKNSAWSLMHEVGHMSLGHKTYKSDFALLKMEAQAWHKAKSIAEEHGVRINSEYIEKCLDSYRDWIYGRSNCRECLQTGLEVTTGVYRCINCNFRWKVSPERFCRVYRKSFAGV